MHRSPFRHSRHRLARIQRYGQQTRGTTACYPPWQLDSALAWIAEEGAANIGFAGQRRVLEHVRGWLPAEAVVMLLADRFYPSAALFTWLDSAGWHYRLRLKSNLLADPGYGDETTTGALACGVTERYLPGVQLFAEGVLTNVGIVHERGHPAPWIIAMECPPRPCGGARLRSSLGD